VPYDGGRGTGKMGPINRKIKIMLGVGDERSSILEKVLIALSAPAHTHY
jgi:hypothetical protein